MKAVIIAVLCSTGLGDTGQSACKTMLSHWIHGIGQDRIRGIPGSDLYGGRERLFCGPYTLYQAMLTAGAKPPSIQEMIRASHAETGTCSALDLVRAARQFGFPQARAVRLDMRNLGEGDLPAIAFLRDPSRHDGHFVLLARRSGDHIQVIDHPRFIAWVPASRFTTFSKAWQGELIALNGPSVDSMAPVRAGLMGAGIVFLIWGLWRIVRRLTITR